MTRPVKKLTVLLVVSTLGASLIGCGGGADPVSSLARANEQNLQRLANLYFTFQMKHEWRGPRDEAEFKSFLRGYNPDKLERIGIDPSRIDALFLSERDGQPFTIRYGLRGSAMGSSEPVIFESEGVGGQRLVGFLNMEQKEVPEQEYNNLLAGRKPAPPAQRDDRP